jgi:hypothetical protein
VIVDEKKDGMRVIQGVELGEIRIAREHAEARALGVRRHDAAFTRRHAAGRNTGVMILEHKALDVMPVGRPWRWGWPDQVGGLPPTSKRRRAAALQIIGWGRGGAAGNRGILLCWCRGGGINGGRWA